MAVKARWPAPPVEIDTSDPFGSAAPAPARVEEVGVPIELRDDDELFDLVRELLGDESRLHNEGVTCDIKHRDDTSCHACPIAGRYGELCDVGRMQEKVLTELAVNALLPTRVGASPRDPTEPASELQHGR